MKNLSFARNRLNALLRTQVFGALGTLVPRITDMFVSGSVVGMTLTLTVFAGLLVWAAMFFGRDLYFDLMGLEGPVRGQAASYWRVTSVYLAFYPFASVMAFLTSHLLVVNRAMFTF